MLEGIAGRASELKVQGALEASRDPNSAVDAHQAEQKALHEAQAAGAAAYEFDPNATPEQKAAQLKSVRYLRVESIAHASPILTFNTETGSPETTQETSSRCASHRPRRRRDSRIRSTTSKQSRRYLASTITYCRQR